MAQKKPIVRDEKAFAQHIAKMEAMGAKKRAEASKGAKKK